MNSLSVDPPTTPMMTQYLKIKEDYPQALLFYRMGDFYELFFDDAIIASKALNIALTKRGRINNQDIPMCGIPFHAQDNYIARLIQQNYQVAICEQLETPEEAKARGYKIVNRGVVRLITSGTLYEDHLLNDTKNNFLCSFFPFQESFACAWTDISTGDLLVQSFEKKDLQGFLDRIDPSEILLPDENHEILIQHFHSVRLKVSWCSPQSYNPNRQTSTLSASYSTMDAKVFGNFSDPEIACLNSLFNYLERTQKNCIPLLKSPEKINAHAFITLDHTTQQNLEIIRNLQGKTSDTLLSSIKYTQTSSGERLLRSILTTPLQDISKINQRLDVIKFFLENPIIMENLCEILKNYTDIERATMRLINHKGSPRDLQNLAKNLSYLPRIKVLFHNNIPEHLQEIVTNIPGYNKLSSTILSALQEDLPFLAREGNFIKPSFDPGILKLKNIQSTISETLMQLQQTYISDTQVSQLKIKKTSVFGYFIEVPAKQAPPLFQNPLFMHKQTLSNNVRFVTEELNALEQTIATNSEQILNLELKIFQQLIEQILLEQKNILRTAKYIALLDVLLGFAQLAKKNNYCYPIVCDEKILHIQEGRHPVLEKKQSFPFVANDCVFSHDYQWIITGPNMGGKSTFLRQTALIILLAHIGSYVPATSAHIGLMDQIFSRIGASDKLSQGQSTFMVEMLETASILHRATERSFVILDEIGRGTSTFDGLSIAWAISHYLHTHIQCYTLFATHYHEMSQLKTICPHLSCYTVAIKEWNNSLHFMYKIIEGESSKSYGIHAATLAGLPKVVLDQAKKILQQLETTQPLSLLYPDSSTSSSTHSLCVDSDSVSAPYRHVLQELIDLNMDEMSPKDALDILYKMQCELKNNPQSSYL